MAYTMNIEDIFIHHYGHREMSIIFSALKSINEAKTYIVKNDYRGIRFVYKNDDGDDSITGIIIPHIKDVQVIKNKVVIVNFADGSKEKAVLDASDTFSLEQGISICITKKILSMQTDGNGSSAYNKLIDHCVKIYKDNCKAKEKADEQTAKEKANKAEAKKLKKANRNREKEIEIQKEAYLRAMREFGSNSAVNN